MNHELLTFEAFEHKHDYGDPPPYLLDHTSKPPRKYKESDGIKVYENGMVLLEPYASGNPDLRRRLRERYGLDVRLLSEFSGYDFLTPDGRYVNKYDIGADSYLLDHRYMKLFRPHGLRLYGPHAQLLSDVGPSSSRWSQVGVYVRDDAKVKRVLASAPQATLDLARSYYIMNSDMPGPDVMVFKSWFDKELIWPEVIPGETALPDNPRTLAWYWHLGMRVEAGTLRKTFLEWTKHREEQPYLLVEERKQLDKAA